MNLLGQFEHEFHWLDFETYLNSIYSPVVCVIKCIFVSTNLLGDSTGIYEIFLGESWLFNYLNILRFSTVELDSILQIDG